MWLPYSRLHAAGGVEMKVGVCRPARRIMLMPEGARYGRMLFWRWLQ
jgi:hypothetical protein